MELAQAITEIVKRYGLDAIFQPRIRSYLMDYGVSDSSASLFIILLKNPDFCTIIRNSRSVDDWGSKISGLAESTMLQPSFIKAVIEELLGIELDIDASGGSEKVRVQGTMETDDFVYEGQMVDGCPDGWGVMTFKKDGKHYKDGYRKYVGEIKYLEGSLFFDGEGTVTISHGTYKGRLKKGLFIPGDIIIDVRTENIRVCGSVRLEEELTHLSYVIHLFCLRGDGITETFGREEGCIFKGKNRNGKAYDGVMSLKHMKDCYIDVRNGVFSPIYKKLPNGNKITGEIVNGKMKGRCTITYPNGDYYEGNVQDDLRQGDGTYRFRDGTVIHALWHCNECSCLKEVFINGVCYRGSLRGTTFEGKENKMFGKKITTDIIFKP